MSDIMAETMVTGFKRLPQRAYLGGHTSRFGSRTHFQLATFYALTETPEVRCENKQIGREVGKQVNRSFLQPQIAPKCPNECADNTS